MGLPSLLHTNFVCVFVCTCMRTYTRLHVYIAVLNPTSYLVVPSRFGYYV